MSYNGKFISKNLVENIKSYTSIMYDWYIQPTQYCKRKNLHVVDVFFETSEIKSYEKDCMNKLLDYLKRNKTKQAVVFYSRKTYLKCVDISKLLPFMQSGQIELRFAKDNVIIGH